MKTPTKPPPRNGDYCQVVEGPEKGKWGTVRGISTSQTGAITITVVQDDGARFNTLAKNVVVQHRS